MTDMQRRFMENWSKSDFAESAKHQAYKDAGYATEANVTTTLKSKAVNKVYREILRRKGITLSKLATKHDELLNAEKKAPDGTMEPDNGVQLRALQEGYRIYDVYPPERHKLDVKREEDIRITLEDQRKAEKILQECVDAEIIEPDVDSGDPQASNDAPDRPLY
jgi:rubrerythrin